MQDQPLPFSPESMQTLAVERWNEVWAPHAEVAHRMSGKPKLMASIADSIATIMPEFVAKAADQAAGHGDPDIAISIPQMANVAWKRSTPQAKQKIQPQAIYLLMRSVLEDLGFEIDGNKVIIHCDEDIEVPEPEPESGGLALTDDEPEAGEEG